MIFVSFFSFSSWNTFASFNQYSYNLDVLLAHIYQDFHLKTMKDTNFHNQPFNTHPITRIHG